ncbi:MAG: hypothetical protein ACI8ZN_000154 [Bacteroidia bacterium]|jgi:hypothetical protein
MINSTGNKKIEALLTAVRKKFVAADIVSELKEIREIARIETNPALVKICRLAYQYIEQNGNLDIEMADEEEELGMPVIEYLLECMLHSDKEINQMEIKEIRDILMAELY